MPAIRPARSIEFLTVNPLCSCSFTYAAGFGAAFAARTSKPQKPKQLGPRHLRAVERYEHFLEQVPQLQQRGYASRGSGEHGAMRGEELPHRDPCGKCHKGLDSGVFQHATNGSRIIPRQRLAPHWKIVAPEGAPQTKNGAGRARAVLSLLVAARIRRIRLLAGQRRLRADRRRLRQPRRVPLRIARR